MADAKEASTMFRPCVDYEGYEVNENGVVRNIRTGYELKHFLRGGYPTVHLSTNVRVHRLVAQAWLPPDPNPKRNSVNHIDGKKENCHVSNLEWVTRSENSKHAYTAGLRGKKTRGKGVESIDAEGNIRQYISLHEAARAANRNVNAIHQAVDHEARSCAGLKWRTTKPIEVPVDEDWRELRECDGKTFAYSYWVSNFGKVKGMYGYPLSPATNGDGYKYVVLRIQEPGAQKTPRAFYLNRLIATAFLGPAPHPEHKVDHIDTDRGNNAVENLRWAASRENTTFAQGVSIIQKTSDGGEIIARFASMSLAAEAVNRERSSISHAIKRGSLCGDYRWERA